MQRTIKSFVLRNGRITKRQQQGLDCLSEVYILTPKTAPWNLQALFAREAKTIVEIGFGMGRSLISMAQQFPEINFIGIEVHRPGIGSLLADIMELSLTNIRIISFDAVQALKDCFLENSLDGIQIFFPDPWHKKRHHKRRLIQEEFVMLLVQRLKTGGFIHCATDWEDYADQMLAVLSANSRLENVNPTAGFTPRPATRPVTKFEQRGKNLGHEVWDLIFTKKMITRP